MRIDPWKLIPLLIAMSSALSWWALLSRSGSEKVYVFMPLLQVLPSSVAMTRDDACAGALELPTGVGMTDARSALGYLGSTLSLDDIEEGIKAFSNTELALEPGQERRISGFLAEAQAERAELVELQAQILDQERAIQATMKTLVESLPPERRARVEARLPRKTAPMPGKPPPRLDGGHP